MYVKEMPLTLDQVKEAIVYDPITGSFTWKIAPNRRTHAGDEAGQWKRIRTTAGEEKSYKYIGLLNYQTPAARVAWLLTYGEWPKGNLVFKDGDTRNLTIDNLGEPEFLSVKSMREGRRSYKMSREAQRHYGLKRYYGLSGEEYGAMLAAQQGLCSICGKPETVMFNGTPKVMHVDHDHATGRIRDLLCGSCNGMLGLAKDSPETLRAAAAYIERHAASGAGNVIPMRPDTKE